MKILPFDSAQGASWLSGVAASESFFDQKSPQPLLVDIPLVDEIKLLKVVAMT